MAEELLDPKDEGFSDDEIIRFTQKTRKELVSKLTEGGMPDDGKERSLLLNALHDMDTTAINNKRLGAQQKTADADRKAMLIAAKLRESMGNQNPFEAGSSSTGEGRTIEPDLDRLPAPNTVDGETDIGIDATNYDEFMSRYDD